MTQVSRPMQIALGAVLVLALAWFVALRPKPSTVSDASAPAAQDAPAAPGTAGLTRAVDKAKGAVVTADKDAQRAAQSDAGAGATAATGTGTAAARPDAARSAAAARPRAPATDHPARHRAATAHHAAAHAPTTAVGSVRTALRQHKVVAIAFVDSGTADARAVAQELHHVSHFGGRAYTIAIPIAHLSRYDFITRGVQVTIAPTVVIVAPNRTATTIVGFADRGEIQQRIADALLVKRAG